MPNLNKDALDIWNALRPMIDKEIERRTMGMVQRRKAKVTTAPSLVTQKIGVTEPFGDQYFIPFNTNLSTAQVGDVVWVEFMYGATNAFASMYASADSKDVTVGGVLDVVNRRCSATMSSAGWYRVFLYSSTNDDELAGSKSANIRITITREGIVGNSFRNEVRFIDFSLAYGSYIFSNETSVTQSLAIDKIRYGYDLTNHFGFIDIHCKRNDSNPITVSFNVETDLETQGEMASVEPYSVADAPSGETVLAVREFVANSEEYNVVDLANKTINSVANTTLATMTAPLGTHRLEGSVLIRLENADTVQRMLLGVGDCITTIVNAYYLSMPFNLPVVGGTAYNVVTYLFDSGARPIYEGSVYYRFC